MKNRITALAVTALMICVGCDVEEERAAGEAALAEQSIPLVSADLGDDVTWQFYSSNDGQIVVSELAPAGARSPLAMVAKEMQPSALELFKAAASDAEAPEVLVLDHQRIAETRATPIEVRSIAIPKRNSKLFDSGLKPLDSGWDEYAADCSLASDGQDWFDFLWQALGWNDHWYYAGSASSKVTPWKSTSDVITHLCNVSNGPERTFHGVRSSMAESGIANVVPIGYRSVYYSYTSTVRTWQGSMYADTGNSGSYKLGIMAP
jgi:hypothetical protein